MGLTASGLVVRRGPFRLELPDFALGDGGTALLGPNGAGKTSLLLALQGLIPAAGQISRPARGAAVFARPAVLRGSVLWNVATVASATATGPETSEMPGADSRRRAGRALADVGLADYAQADARTLSTGQRQRLALARALACDAQALYLDEPFANVDADGRPALRALVRSWAEVQGHVLVLATSSLADAAALCADVLVLRAGSMVHSGPVRALADSHDPYIAALLAESRAAALHTA